MNLADWSFSSPCFSSLIFFNFRNPSFPFLTYIGYTLQFFSNPF